jgi:hypothetical protein
MFFSFSSMSSYFDPGCTEHFISMNSSELSRASLFGSWFFSFFRDLSEALVLVDSLDDLDCVDFIGVIKMYLYEFWKSFQYII